MLDKDAINKHLNKLVARIFALTQIEGMDMNLQYFDCVGKNVIVIT